LENFGEESEWGSEDEWVPEDGVEGANNTYTSGAAELSEWLAE
jgi:hypothetical protein